jgi:molybdate transport system ATP-binding protein
MTIAVSLAGQIGPDFALDVDLALPMAGVTGLFGPSGSGKTTVLRALAGLERIPGVVRFGDEVWQDGGVFVPAHRRHIGYVFQGAGLLPHLTVARNLDYAARRAPPGPFDRETLVARAGIGALLDRSPARLSGGEMQRAAIVRALLSQPRLLLMDEPLAALDGEAKAALLALFEDLLGAIAIPVVYVTHDEVEALRLATRCVRLRGGAVQGIETGS